MTTSRPELAAAGPSIVLAGGGTAGHVSPLLAIAAAVRRARPEARVTVVGTASGMEARLVPAAGLPLETLDRVPLPRRPSVDLVKLPWRLRRAIGQAQQIIEKTEADVIVGVGGYVCTPMYLAARRMGVPIVIHEANARPGLANRVGARFAAVVATAFPDSPLPGARTVGMPMREQISQLDRTTSRGAARRGLGLDPDLPTLVVTGGSSGALAMNRTIAAIAGEVADHGYQLLHITGRGKQARTAGGQLLTAPHYHQVEYVDGMEQVYAAADLLVARAGAATVSEVAAVGLPAVFVPLPIGNGEQALNARSLVDAGAARLVDDAAFTPELFRSEIAPLMTGGAQLQAMAQAARGEGIRDADRTMAELILTEADHD